nr:MAG TPA: hypothetical protein [Caudoviricetes sp.]
MYLQSHDIQHTIHCNNNMILVLITMKVPMKANISLIKSTMVS